MLFAHVFAPPTFPWLKSMPVRQHKEAEADVQPVCTACDTDIVVSGAAEAATTSCDLHVLCVLCRVPALLAMLRTVGGNLFANASRRAALLSRVEVQITADGTIVSMRVPCPARVALGACGDNCVGGAVNVAAFVTESPAGNPARCGVHFAELRHELLQLADATPAAAAVRSAQRPRLLEESTRSVVSVPPPANPDAVMPSATPKKSAPAAAEPAKKLPLAPPAGGGAGWIPTSTSVTATPAGWSSSKMHGPC